MMSDYTSCVLTQSLIAQRRRDVDPWKSIEKVQSANRGTPSAEAENAVAQAVKALRIARHEVAKRMEPKASAHQHE
jgi:hypothetical protein